MSALSRSLRAAASRHATSLPLVSPLPARSRTYATPSSDPAASSSSAPPPPPSEKPEEEPMVYKAPELSRRGEGALLKTYRGPGFPFLNSLRNVVHVHHPHLWKGSPLKPLTIPLRRSGGRNNTGKITSRFRGGGHKRRIRLVDFYRYEGGEHDVVRIEYDPGRSAHIALIRRRGGAKQGVHADEGARLAELSDNDNALVPVEGSTKLTKVEKRKKRDEVKGGWSYILAPDGLRAGDVVRSFRTGIPKGIVEGWGTPSEFDTPEEEEVGIDKSKQTFSETVSPRSLGLLRTFAVKAGNVLPLYLIPPGTLIHNLATDPMGKFNLVRSAGTNAQIVAHHDEAGQSLGGTAVLDMGGRAREDGTMQGRKGWVLVKLQSGEVRRLHPGSCATIGTVSNKEHHHEVLGKAGRARWLGRRPRQRGVSMNAVDHPHGGGRGKSKGNKHPRSIWGKVEGIRTRKPGTKNGNKMVVSERPRGPHRRKG